MEEYLPWYCDAIPAPLLVEFEEISYGAGMTIKLRETYAPKRRITFHFPDLPTAIRIANESQRLISLARLPPGPRHSFFLVQGSEFLAWMNGESKQIYANDPIFHLVVLTDEWIDLICNEEPIVTISESSPKSAVDSLRPAQ